VGWGSEQGSTSTGKTVLVVMGWPKTENRERSMNREPQKMMAKTHLVASI